MRLISQDGKGDMPYENFIFRVYGEDIVASRDILTNGKQIVARYSTEAKAKKVLEMLKEYKETKEIRSIPLTKSLMESFSNVKMENFEIYTDGTGDYLKVDIVKKVEYFKFPADEEVEV